MSEKGRTIYIPGPLVPIVRAMLDSWRNGGCQEGLMKAATEVAASVADQLKAGC